jgi:Ca2+-binding EF-hand superfamily protein
MQETKMKNVSGNAFVKVIAIIISISMTLPTPAVFALNETDPEDRGWPTNSVSVNAMSHDPAPTTGANAPSSIDALMFSPLSPSLSPSDEAEEFVEIDPPCIHTHCNGGNVPDVDIDSSGDFEELDLSLPPTDDDLYNGIVWRLNHDLGRDDITRDDIIGLAHVRQGGDVSAVFEFEGTNYSATFNFYMFIMEQDPQTGVISERSGHLLKSLEQVDLTLDVIGTDSNDDRTTKAFQTADTNDDGVISAEEAAIAFLTSRAAIPSQAGDPDFDEAFDFDNNGVLNVIDTIVLVSVLIAAGQGAVVLAINAVDTDRDSEISADEAAQGLLDVFNALGTTNEDYDFNQDGFVDAQDLDILTAIVDSVLSPNSGERTTGEAIEAYLNVIRSLLDVDGDGDSDASSDGNLVLRYLLGFRGEDLTQGTANPNGDRNTADAIVAYLDALVVFGILDTNNDGKTEYADGLAISYFLFGLEGDKLIEPYQADAEPPVDLLLGVALVDLSKTMDLTIEELRQLIESYELDDEDRLVINFKEGQMGDARLIDVLGNGELPDTVAYQLERTWTGPMPVIHFFEDTASDGSGTDRILPPNPFYGITSADWTWNESDTQSLNAHINYDELGRINDILWTRREEYHAGSPDTGVIGLSVTFLYEDHYSYNDDGSIKISRGLPFTIQELASSDKILAGGQNAYPVLGLNLVMTLEILADGKHHITKLEEYNGDEKVSTTEFRYWEVYTCNNDGSACSGPAIALRGLTRTDADGNRLSETIVDGNNATVKVEGIRHEINFTSLDNLLSQIKEIEATAPQLRQIKALIRNDLSNLTGLTKEELRALLESVEFDRENLTVTIRFSEGAMSDARLIDVLGNGDMPDTVVYQLTNEMSGVGHPNEMSAAGVIASENPSPGPAFLDFIVESVTMTWNESDTQTLIANLSYENGKLARIDWSREIMVETGVIYCLPAPGMSSCEHDIQYETFTQFLHVDTYDYSDGNITITRSPYLTLQEIDPPVGPWDSPWYQTAETSKKNAEYVGLQSIRSDVLIMTLEKLEDGKYHITMLEEFDVRGNMIATTQFQYEAGSRACVWDCPPEIIMFLTDVTRTDANGDPLSDTSVDGNSATVTVEGIEHDINFSNLEDLLAQIKQIEATAPQLRQIKALLVNDIVATFGLSRDRVTDLIDQGLITMDVDIADLTATVHFDPSIQVGNAAYLANLLGPKELPDTVEYTFAPNSPMPGVPCSTDDCPIFIQTYHLVSGNFEIQADDQHLLVRLDYLGFRSHMNIRPEYHVGNNRLQMVSVFDITTTTTDLVLIKQINYRYNESGALAGATITYPSGSQGDVASRDVTFWTIDGQKYISSVTDKDENGVEVVLNAYWYEIIVPAADVCGANIPDCRPSETSVELLSIQRQDLLNDPEPLPGDLQHVLPGTPLSTITFPRPGEVTITLANGARMTIPVDSMEEAFFMAALFEMWITGIAKRQDLEQDFKHDFKFEDMARNQNDSKTAASEAITETMARTPGRRALHSSRDYLVQRTTTATSEEARSEVEEEKIETDVTKQLYWLEQHDAEVAEKETEIKNASEPRVSNQASTLKSLLLPSKSSLQQAITVADTTPETRVISGELL